MKARAKQDEVREAKYIREGSKVIAITGNDKGRVGVVLSRNDTRALVQGINIRKKHVKASQENPKGGVISIEGPIHVSNLMLVTAEEKPVRVKVRVSKKGEKELVYKDGDKQVVLRSVNQGKQ